MEEYESSKYNSDDPVAMDAADFRSQVGEVIEAPAVAEDGEEPEITFSLSNQQRFNQLIQNLKVIGRAEPGDKQLLIAGLRGMGQKVGVVGEGINDVDAFRIADVSFAVGEGASYARNNASMVLTTNDFDSCMRAVMWGRNIIQNVQRFLQFQVTCNIAVMVVVIVSYATMTDSCLNAVQLIYINLIMDILGALALASTRPSTEIAKFRAGEQNLLTPSMYRQIFGVSAFMIAIMMVMMYCGKSIFEIPYPASTNTTDKTIEGENKMEHMTLVWNCFIFLQWFNLINCRDISPTKMHGFSALHRNLLSIFVLLVIFGVQFLACFTFLGRPIFETQTVTAREFAVCVVAGASVLIANALLKAIPERWISKMPTLDEKKAIGGNSKMMAAYNKQAHAKAYTKKTGPAYEEVGDDDGYQE